MGRNDYYGGWAPYVPVAERQRNARKMLDALKKKGQPCQPVIIEGRAIVRTFWGKKWCDNLEAYSDYANRLPRGRTYVRNGSVINLQMTAGKIEALVSGSEVYKISINVRALDEKRWQTILNECAGKVSSLVELLQGRLSSAVMEVVTRHGSGLFPNPQQIDFRCSCPDSASMCKHVAATLYGIGARLDQQPELLFQLRQVDPQELIMQSAILSMPATQTALGENQRLESADLSAMFGIELGEAPMANQSILPPKTKTAARDSANTSARSPDAKAAGKMKSVLPAAKVSSSKKQAAPRPKRVKTMTASALTARGIPRHMIQKWLNSDVLLRTDKRGVYGVTKHTEGRIKEYLRYQ